MNYTSPYYSMQEGAVDKFDLRPSSCYNDFVQRTDIIEYWLKSASEDYKTAEGLLSLKRYAHSLFFCHLTIEKCLKALVVKNTGMNAPFDHNLSLLSNDTGISFTTGQLDLLDEINTFNIKARYDDFRFKFYKKATKDYAQKYFDETTKLYLWLQEQIKK